MKKHHGWWLVLLLGLMFWFGGQQVSAADNPYVDDEANVLSEKTMQQVKALNDNELKTLPGHPQLVVQTIEDLPSDTSMDEYKTEHFNAVGIGNADWDNGVLFVLATDAREYGMEVGYGLEAALPDASESDIITDKVEAYLKAERYDEAVGSITKQIAKILVANKAEISTPAAVKRSKDQAFRRKIAWIIGGVSLFAIVFFTFFFAFRQQKRLKQLLMASQTTLPLFASLLEKRQKQCCDELPAKLFGRFPKDPEAYLQQHVAQYVRKRWHILVADAKPKAKHPMFAYAGVKASALPQDDAALNDFLSVNDIVTVLEPTVTRDLEKLDPSATHFAQWAKANKVSRYQQVKVWKRYVAGVRKAKGKMPETKAEFWATFNIILQGFKRQVATEQDLANAAYWARRDQEEREERWRQQDAEAARRREEENKSPFEGGSSGGGGFSGKW